MNRFSSKTFAAVIETAKAKAANSPAWLRAIDKAAAALVAGEIKVHIFDSFALVVNKSGEVYKVNGVCECAAAKHGNATCYHRAAVRLIERYEAAALAQASKPTKPPRETREALIAAIQQAWPATWPPLAVELMARFRVNSLNFLDNDMLRRVRLAVAL